MKGKPITDTIKLKITLSTSMKDVILVRGLISMVASSSSCYNTPLKLNEAFIGLSMKFGELKEEAKHLLTPKLELHSV